MPNGAGRRLPGLIAPFLALLALAACAGTLAASSPPDGEARTLKHQGVERHYYLQNAEAAAATPAPLVVSLHGYRGPDQALAERENLSDIASASLYRVALREGFIVSYPHAWLGKWSQFEGLENTALEDGRTVDDQGFIARMIERLVDDGLADPERVYLTGFSDGAIMSYKLLCTAGAPFAAAAPVAGTMYQKHRDTCAATVPIPLLVIAGTDDRSLPYDGWLFSTGREISIPETMEQARCTVSISVVLPTRMPLRPAATTRRASMKRGATGPALTTATSRARKKSGPSCASSRGARTLYAQQPERSGSTTRSSVRSMPATSPSSPTACKRACVATSWAGGGPHSPSQPARAAVWPGRGVTVGPPRRHTSETFCSSASTTGRSRAVSSP